MGALRINDCAPAPRLGGLRACGQAHGVCESGGCRARTFSAKLAPASVPSSRAGRDIQTLTV